MDSVWATRPPHGQRAFSLIEIMVTVALLAVIIVGLMAMFYQVQRAFRGGTAQADVMEGGRATMSLITREAQEASAAYLGERLGVAPAAAVINLGVVPPFGASVTGPTSSQTLVGNESRANHLRDFFFLSRQNDEWVGIAYRLTGAESGVGTLHRLIDRRPLANVDNLATNIAVSSPSPTSPDYNTNFHRVLDGVVHFNVTAFGLNGAPFPYDPQNPQPYIVGAGNPPVLLGYYFTSNALPAFIDIELAVLEPATLEKFRYRFQAENAVTPLPPYPKSSAYLANQASRTHVFRQRIPIRPSAADTGDGP